MPKLLPLPDPTDAIPADLRGLHRWAVSVADKVPRSPMTGNLARCNDPSTCGTFAQAQAYAAAMGSHGSVVLHFLLAGDGIVGVDLDKCRDPVTAEIQSWASAVIERLDAYTEQSPSGTGIRIFAMGQLPPRGSKKGSIEVYADRKFLSVTGRRIGACDRLPDRSAELMAWHREVFGDLRESTKKQNYTPSCEPDIDAVMLDRLPFHARLNLSGKRDCYASASEADWALAKDAIRAGYGLEDVIELLVQARINAGQQIKCDAYFQRTAERAWEAVAAEAP